MIVLAAALALWEPLLAVGLFLFGLRLSALFSGSETGFYRQSVPRLTIDAQAGDHVSQRLLWFARRPAHFVATTLIGNNVANYIVTFAISLGGVALFGHESETREVMATVLFAPVIFLLGELLPKNLYYRSPSLLRRDLRWLQMFYTAFRPATLPLVALTRLLERFSRGGNQSVEIMLGRSRLVQVMESGRQEGLLTDVQSRLANGLLQTAPQPIVGSMIPAHRVLGVGEGATAEEVVEFARRFGLASVPLHHAGAVDQWFGYVRVAELVVLRKPLAAAVRIMPVIDARLGKLEAMHLMRQAEQTYGAVVEGDRVVGVVSERGLMEQFFRPPPVGLQP